MSEAVRPEDYLDPLRAENLMDAEAVGQEAARTAREESWEYLQDGDWTEDELHALGWNAGREYGYQEGQRAGAAEVLSEEATDGGADFIAEWLDQNSAYLEGAHDVGDALGHAYDAGYAAANKRIEAAVAQARADERVRIVAWLEAKSYHGDPGLEAIMWAIERGEYAAAEGGRA